MRSSSRSPRSSDPRLQRSRFELAAVAAGAVAAAVAGCNAGGSGVAGGITTTRFLTEMEALDSVFPDAVRIVPDDLVLDASERNAASALVYRPIQRSSYRSFIGVRASGELDGYAFIHDEIGKFKPFTFIAAIEPDGSVRRVAILVYRESRGGEIAKRRYLAQYPGKTVRDPIRGNRDIINIQGATMSIDSLNYGIKELLAVTEVAYRRDPERVRALIASGREVDMTLDMTPESASAPAPANREDGLVEVREARLSMGAICEIRAWHGDALRARAAVRAALDEVDACERDLSDYRPDSDLSRLTRLGHEREVAITARTADFLGASERMSRSTDGAFDLTIGSLVRAWGFRRAPSDRRPLSTPSDAMLDELGAMSVGHEFVLLHHDDGIHRASIARRGVVLDPGGIGKGFAVDRAVAVLRSHEVERALIEFSSTTFALGSPPGSDAWTVAIRDPLVGDRIAGHVELRDEALSVSGSHGRVIEIDGRTYGHILSPFTRRPVPGLRGAVIVAATATEADALSTAFCVLGTDAVSPSLVRISVRGIVLSADSPKSRRRSLCIGAPVIVPAADSISVEEHDS